MNPSQKYCSCEILVPECYNDGTPISPEIMNKFLEAMDRQFNGWTNTGRREGSYYGQREWTVAIRVDVLESKVEELKKVVYALGKELKQKAMYFECRPSSVEFIDTSDEGGE